MKKIIIVNNNLNIGGVQKALINLLQEIHNEFDITLLLFTHHGEYIQYIPSSVKVIYCSSLFKYLGLSQTDINKYSIHYWLRGGLAFWTKIFGKKIPMKIILWSQKNLNEEYDYAISYLQNGSISSFYGGCNEFVLNKIKASCKISFLHGDFVLCGAKNDYNCDLYKKFDKIALCSVACRDSFIRSMPQCSEKSFTVRNCHNYKKIKALANFNPIKYDTNMINIISVARLSPEKGIARGIKAIQRAIQRGRQVRYHIIGDGKEKESLLQLVNSMELGNYIHFYGNTDNPYRYMKNADILLIPSYHEAAPLVIDEAFYLGVPVLSTNTMSSYEMIVERKCGWVCENQQECLTEKLLEVSQCKKDIDEYKNQIRNFTCDNKKAKDDFYNILNN